MIHLTTTAAGNGEDDDNNSFIKGDEEELLDDDNYVGKLSAACDGIDESISSPAITATMERMKARDRASTIALRQDVEHQCIINLLNLLEDDQCPDYMLQSVLLWAYES